VHYRNREKLEEGRNLPDLVFLSASATKERDSIKAKEGKKIKGKVKESVDWKGTRENA
jgi:hypothetical protein